MSFVDAIKVYAAFGDNPFIFATVWVAEFKEQDRLMRAAVVIYCVGKQAKVDKLNWINHHFLPTWSLKIFEMTTGTLCSAPPWKGQK